MLKKTTTTILLVSIVFYSQGGGGFKVLKEPADINAQKTIFECYSLSEECVTKIFFLFLDQNIRCGYSKEPSQ